MAGVEGRTEFNRAVIDECELDADPIRQFEKWLREAQEAGAHEPHAMTLATATPAGRPSARVVLLRAVDVRGFSFFTNYDSRKGNELEANPQAALVFYWGELERQVRVEGRVGRVEASESDAYFASRPVGSRIGAWASPQSAVIAGRHVLDQAAEAVRREFPDDAAIVRPPNWGGFRVVPLEIEFWQGRANRLHDRFRYRRHDGGPWIRERLAP